MQKARIIVASGATMCFLGIVEYGGANSVSPRRIPARSPAMTNGTILDEVVPFFISGSVDPPTISRLRKAIVSSSQGQSHQREPLFAGALAISANRRFASRIAEDSFCFSF
ncbi:hypothetical protein [Burkholderia gladioli]|uniref:hypothetical protein n=1 Tax=Burkholderia gladioli TaxID=28095 RepID=UPI0016415EB6|nr:hypothetical protein [Burkholderia gladioli]